MTPPIDVYTSSLWLSFYFHWTFYVDRAEKNPKILKQGFLFKPFWDIKLLFEPFIVFSHFTVDRLGMNSQVTYQRYLGEWQLEANFLKCEFGVDSPFPLLSCKSQKNLGKNRFWGEMQFERRKIPLYAGTIFRKGVCIFRWDNKTACISDQKSWKGFP